MTIPVDKKEQAIYHTILADMHRIHALMLNMQTLDMDGTENKLQEHFGRDRNLILGKLTEWRQRKPAIYREAGEDFQHQIRRALQPDATAELE